MNPMEEVVIAKATLNIGVGESGGERLSRAMDLLSNLTGQDPVKTFLKLPILNLVLENTNLLLVKLLYVVKRLIKLLKWF